MNNNALSDNEESQFSAVQWKRERESMDGPACL